MDNNKKLFHLSAMYEYWIEGLQCWQQVARQPDAKLYTGSPFAASHSSPWLCVGQLQYLWRLEWLEFIWSSEPSDGHRSWGASNMVNLWSYSCPTLTSYGDVDFITVDRAFMITISIEAICTVVDLPIWLLDLGNGKCIFIQICGHKILCAGTLFPQIEISFYMVVSFTGDADVSPQGNHARRANEDERLGIWFIWMRKRTYMQYVRRNLYSNLNLYHGSHLHGEEHTTGSKYEYRWKQRIAINPSICWGHSELKG